METNSNSLEENKTQEPELSLSVLKSLLISDDKHLTSKLLDGISMASYKSPLFIHFVEKLLCHKNPDDEKFLRKLHCCEYILNRSKTTDPEVYKKIVWTGYRENYRPDGVNCQSLPIYIDIILEFKDLEGLNTFSSNFDNDENVDLETGDEYIPKLIISFIL